MSDPQQPQKAEPWWKAFPAPKARCPTLFADEVLKLVEEKTNNGEMLLVDVRRDDWTGGTVAGSINLPAQSLYATRGAVYDMCKRAGVKRVVFYCGSCSDGGRGWKCANWFQDYIDEKGDSQIQALMLEGGMKGWVKRFGAKGIEGFDKKCWQ